MSCGSGASRERDRYLDGITARSGCYPHIGLYGPDGSHPSPAGSCLAVLIHLFTVTGGLPSAVTYDGPLEPTLARALRSVAAEFLTGKL